MRSHLGSLARAAVVSIGFWPGMWLAAACADPAPEGECSPGAAGCECALGFCDDGLSCEAGMCVAAGTSSSTTDDDTSTGGDDTTSTTDDADSSSSDTGSGDDSSSTGEPPNVEPHLDATLDGVPTSFTVDPRVYVGPAGTVIARGIASGGAGGELIVRFPPTGPGTHPCVLDDTGVAIYWTTQGPMGSLELSTRTSGVCTVTIDEYGEVGEPIAGTFEGNLVIPGAEVLPAVVVMAGSFHLVRSPDE